MLVTFICLPSRECDKLGLSEAPRSSMKYRFWHQLLTLKRKGWKRKENACYAGLFCLDLGTHEQLGRVPLNLVVNLVPWAGSCLVLPPWKLSFTH